MIYKFICIEFLVLLSRLGYAQSLNKDTVRALCDGPAFTLCEKMPYLKNGILAFEDSLNARLGKIQDANTKKRLQLSLVILRSGEVKYVTLEGGQTDSLGLIENALKSLSNEWAPGVQNGKVVCCYRRQILDFQTDRIKAYVPEGL